MLAVHAVDPASTGAPELLLELHAHTGTAPSAASTIVTPS
jgi:hypothetical protein